MLGTVYDKGEWKSPKLRPMTQSSNGINYAPLWGASSGHPLCGWYLT
ncbi:MAG: hypothetical protein H6Q05_4378, partial [Acidobacteria bacterium]|nr:hypothetical protein [Acidobacteriota bacterium]